MVYTFPYHGGVYSGQIKFAKKNKSGREKTCARQSRMIPHGKGTFTYRGVTFNGVFRNGYEERGKLSWPDGTTFIGNFNSGFPEPKVLKSYHQKCVLKKRILFLQSELLLKQAQIEDLKDDLDIEKETTSAVSLSLDRCQSKLQRLFEFASARGVDAAELHNIYYG